MSQNHAGQDRKQQLMAELESMEQDAIQRLSRKVLVLEQLLRIGPQITTLDLDDAIKLVLRHFLELTEARRGLLMLIDEAGELVVEYALGTGTSSLSSEELAFSHSIASRARAEGEVVIVEQVADSAYRDQPSVVHLGLEALMAIPLGHGQGGRESLGVIYLDTDGAGHRITRDDLTTYAAFASHAATALANARRHRSLEDDYFRLQRRHEQSLCFADIRYASRAMHEVCRLIRKAAASDITVLVRGETGTGKELVARAIHSSSCRRDRRFLVQNTGALPDSLLESELFGHRRGAFSGAVESRIGLFEAADGGSVLLDEIGEASPALQVRLLRFLETGTYRRIGETTDRRADVRIIAATHRDLEAEVAAGRFREDLYYRLSVLPITVPPLRERREDIPVLARHFVDELNQSLGRSVRTIAAPTLDVMTRRDWRGNVRELRSFVQRLMVLSSGDELRLDDPPDEPPARGETSSGRDLAADHPPAAPADSIDPAGSPLGLRTLEEMERDYIAHVLEVCGGNQAEAARRLGLNRSTLRWRLKKLGLRG